MYRPCATSTLSVDGQTPEEQSSADAAPDSKQPFIRIAMNMVGLLPQSKVDTDTYSPLCMAPDFRKPSPSK